MNLQVNQKRLWSRLMSMAQIGATPAGGCNRQALSDQDFAARQLFEQWAIAAGCSIRRDPIGNVFCRRPGLEDTAPAVMSGSHLDTQPTGGRFDGVYGVLAALEVIDTLNDLQVRTRHPLDVVVWTNEEGSRFDCAMMGSAVWAGNLALGDALALKDLAGNTVQTELNRLGIQGEAPFKHNIKSAFELHIEQGPILENAGLPIGIVTGVQHMCRYRIHFHGQETHAGPSPMPLRQDPVRSLADFLTSTYEITNNHAPGGRVTFGYLNAEPGSPNTVPGTVEVTLDLRHPEQQDYLAMINGIEKAMQQAAQQHNNTVVADKVWEAPGVTFDQHCVNYVRSAAHKAGLAAMDMVSGAGHDACNVAAVAPTAMIFVPCDNGLSHNEAENISPVQAANGTNVLLHAMLAAAEQV